ncbi:hypothetical protein [Enterococcus rotai]
MITTANLILLAVSIICFATGETVQGIIFLAVMWVGSIATRMRKEDEK